MPDPDVPAATLEEARACVKRFCNPPDWVGGPPDVRAAKALMPRLLGAVEAVLKLADRWMNTPWPEDGGDRAGVATEQIILDGIALRAAITAALALASSPPEAGIPTSSRGD